MADDLDARPDVSVLVMAYNHAAYIGECLDSILAQRFDGRVEILVGEDCSTDDTLAVVTEYAQRHASIGSSRRPTTSGCTRTTEG